MVTRRELIDEAQISNQEALVEKEAKRASLSTDGSNLSVPTLGKSSSKQLVGGGYTSYLSSVSPSDLVPVNGKNQVGSQPDYYRFGNREVETIIVDGEQRERVIWKPLPALIGDRKEPMFASIKLIDFKKASVKNGENPADLPNIIPEYSKFFLESVQESRSEKVQIVETFGDFYSFFYGEKPPIYNFSGYLLNTLNYNWMNEFMYYYENFWRGTRSVALGARIFLTYNYQQVQGYIISVNTSLNAVTDRVAPFSFSMLVLKRLIFTGTADDNVVRDSLLPQNDTGYINENVDSKALAQVTKYLQNKVPASSHEMMSSQIKSYAKRVIEKSGQSVIKQEPATINASQFQDFSSRGQGMANSLKSNLGLGGLLG